MSVRNTVSIFVLLFSVLSLASHPVDNADIESPDPFVVEIYKKLRMLPDPPVNWQHVFRHYAVFSSQNERSKYTEKLKQELEGEGFIIPKIVCTAVTVNTFQCIYHYRKNLPTHNSNLNYRAKQVLFKTRSELCSTYRYLPGHGAPPGMTNPPKETYYGTPWGVWKWLERRSRELDRQHKKLLEIEFVPQSERRAVGFIQSYDALATPVCDLY